DLVAAARSVGFCLAAVLEKCAPREQRAKKERTHHERSPLTGELTASYAGPGTLTRLLIKPAGAGFCFNRRREMLAQAAQHARAAAWIGHSPGTMWGIHGP